MKERRRGIGMKEAVRMERSGNLGCPEELIGVRRHDHYLTPRKYRMSVLGHWKPVGDLG